MVYHSFVHLVRVYKNCNRTNAWYDAENPFPVEVIFVEKRKSQQ